MEEALNQNEELIARVFEEARWMYPSILGVREHIFTGR
jgi:hypothetical protein